MNSARCLRALRLALSLLPPRAARQPAGRPAWSACRAAGSESGRPAEARPAVRPSSSPLTPLQEPASVSRELARESYKYFDEAVITVRVRASPSRSPAAHAHRAAAPRLATAGRASRCTRWPSLAR